MPSAAAAHSAAANTARRSARAMIETRTAKWKFPSNEMVKCIPEHVIGATFANGFH